MPYYKLAHKRNISWLVMVIFAISGSLLALSLFLFVLSGRFNYASFGFESASYTSPSHGYLLYDYTGLPAAVDSSSLNWGQSPWSGSLYERQRLVWPVVRVLSEREDLDPALVMALVQVESRFDPTVVSSRGAVGLMQINPATARHLGLSDPTDPESNLRAGISYLVSLHKIFDNDIRLILAAYNAGPTRVKALGQVPEIKETQDFVERVLSQREIFRNRFQ